MARTAFLFPGQGAQNVGMARQLAETLPDARHLFDEAAEILGYSLLDICTSGPVEKLNATVVNEWDSMRAMPGGEGSIHREKLAKVVLRRKRGVP